MGSSTRSPPFWHRAKSSRSSVRTSLQKPALTPRRGSKGRWAARLDNPAVSDVLAVHGRAHPLAPAPSPGGRVSRPACPAPARALEGERPRNGGKALLGPIAPGRACRTPSRPQRAGAVRLGTPATAERICLTGRRDRDHDRLRGVRDRWMGDGFLTPL